MTELEVNGAIQIVAQHVIANGADHMADVGKGCDYPEISAEDWDTIINVVDFLCKYPDPADFDAAIKLLEERADYGPGYPQQWGVPIH